MRSLTFESTPSLLEMLLFDIRSILDQCFSGELPPVRAPNGPGISVRQSFPSADLARLLAEMEGQPWCEWGRTREPITPHSLALLLGQVCVHPRMCSFEYIDQNDRRRTLKIRGYVVEELCAAIDRHLPAQTSADAA